MRRTITMRSLLAAALCFSISVATQSAIAQPTEPSPTAASDRADKLLAEAKALAKSGNLPEAKAKLAEAWSLKKSYDIAGNLCFVQERLQELPAAAKNCEFALRTFPSSGKPEHKTVLLERFAAIRPKVGALRFNVNVAKSSVVVDGSEVGDTPLDAPAFVVPGGHEIEVRRPGYKTNKQVVVVAIGDETVVEVKLEPDAGGGDPNPATTLPSWPTILLATLTGLGGAATIGLGSATGLRSADADDAVERATADGTRCSASPTGPGVCADFRSAAEDQQTFGNATIGVGVFTAAALAGLIGYAVAASNDDGSVTVTPGASSEGASLLVQIRF